MFVNTHIYACKDFVPDAANSLIGYTTDWNVIFKKENIFHFSEMLYYKEAATEK